MTLLVFLVLVNSQNCAGLTPSDKVDLIHQERNFKSLSESREYHAKLPRSHTERGSIMNQCSAVPESGLASLLPNLIS